MRIRTKIVATIGPACNTLDKMIAMIESGMSVARLNFSHGTHEEHQRQIDNLKEARKRTGRPLSIMLDTKGPEIRVGHLKEPVAVKPGQIVTLVPGMVAERKNEIPMIPGNILDGLGHGVTVLFDDGYIVSEVVEASKGGVRLEIKTEGEIRSGKGINIPNVILDIPLVTDNDRADIKFGCENQVDMVAASFIQGPEQIITIKKLLVEHNCPDAVVVAKIETSRGVKNFDAILEVSDAIMIARGDLGVEMPLARVPGLQKMMIRKCLAAGRPSIVATQMLESMIVSPRPTRAEASDVANGIFDSASAVMLSGESAAGKYPIESVATMRDIVEGAEAEFDYEAFFGRAVKQYPHDVPSSVAVASLRTVITAQAAAIFVITSSGRTARILARFRPGVPILALTNSERVYHSLAFIWGVEPIPCTACVSVEQGFEIISKYALEHGYVRQGDLVVITAGVPFGIAGTTNMMVVESIGPVVVRGREGYGKRASGQVAIVFDVQEAIKEGLADKILVLTKCSEETLPLLKKARGVILQNHPEDLESKRYLLLVAKAMGLPTVVGADGASNLLKDDQEITLVPQDNLVYRGTDID